jgi:hypothetical protein
MHYRVPFLVALACVGSAGVLAVACSSNDIVINGDTDSGSDTSIPNSDGGGQDTSKPDSGKVIPLCTTNPIKGECDLVSQNCPNGKECVAMLPDGGNGTSCQDPGTGALGEGEACTAGADNPCIKGLQCQSGVCSKPCCGNSSGTGDSTVCGTTKEGYVGICDLNIIDPKTNATLYSVCEYAKPCQPFGIQPCGTNQTCLVKDGVGSSACSDIYQPPGKAEGATCTAANDCKDGMMCIGSGNNSTCTYVCWFKGSKTPPPFDGGALDGGAGGGGCPKAKTCKAVNWGGALPDWLGTCQ